MTIDTRDIGIIGDLELSCLLLTSLLNRDSYYLFDDASMLDTSDSWDQWRVSLSSLFGVTTIHLIVSPRIDEPDQWRANLFASSSLIKWSIHA